MASVADATATFIKNTEAATGKKITEWVRVARSAGFSKHGGILKWLKENHGLVGHGHANQIAKMALTADDSDVGLILKGVKPTDRLEASGSFNAMFTHRVRVSDKGDIDAELKAWLRQAYREA